MTTENKKPPAVQQIFDFTMKTGQRSGGGERVTAVLGRHGYTIEAVRADWRISASSAGSKSGKLFSLRVLSEDKVVFQATRARENGARTGSAPQAGWVVVAGELPEKLEAVPA